MLEGGAGLGATTQFLCNDRQNLWMCLEPDERMLGEVRKKIEQEQLPACCEPNAGTVESLDNAIRGTFDTVLYIDVLEHIADHQTEVSRAASCLKQDGYLVVLAPAHQWLFTPFDEAIGHYRRYTRSMLTSLTPPMLDLVRLRYLDSVGLLASLGNRLLLRRSMRSLRQVLVWDRFVSWYRFRVCLMSSPHIGLENPCSAFGAGTACRNDSGPE